MACLSVVAVTPRAPMPAISPASRPTLASLDTQQPTNSSSGWAATPSMAARPTLPVAHWITR